MIDKVKPDVTESDINISVIIAVYNVETYLRRCLDSIVNQNYNNLEIIIVDDGSTDNSGKICDEYALTDKRIQVIHKMNGGLVSARKAGINCATGEYSICVDADDWIEIDAYKNVAEKLQKFHPDMLVFGYKKDFGAIIEECGLEFEEGFYTKEKLWKNFNDSIRKKSFYYQPIDMSQWDKVIKTEILKLYQTQCPDNLKKNTDSAVNLPVFFNIDNIYCDEKCYYHYCVRKNSVSWNSSKMDFQHFITLSRHLILAYKESKNKKMINKEILMYNLFATLILDVPEKMICDNKCLYYPKLNINDKLVIYGKGVFATRFICCIQEKRYYSVVANLDKTDVKEIKEIDQMQYDYVVIAILNPRIVEDTIKNLLELGIMRKKIIYVKKEDLSSEILPDEIKELWDEI